LPPKQRVAKSLLASVQSPRNFLNRELREQLPGLVQFFFLPATTGDDPKRTMSYRERSLPSRTLGHRERSLHNPQIGQSGTQMPQIAHWYWSRSLLNEKVSNLKFNKRSPPHQNSSSGNQLRPS
jgi:hypothetical protein